MWLVSAIQWIGLACFALDIYSWSIAFGWRYWGAFSSWLSDITGAFSREADISKCVYYSCHFSCHLFHRHFSNKHLFECWRKLVTWFYPKGSNPSRGDKQVSQPTVVLRVCDRGLRGQGVSPLTIWNGHRGSISQPCQASRESSCRRHSVNWALKNEELARQRMIVDFCFGGWQPFRQKELGNSSSF